jgi:hypothetical protein
VLLRGYACLICDGCSDLSMESRQLWCVILCVVVAVAVIVIVVVIGVV